jgi:Icc-related predicted phosphoesterase
MKIIIFSDWHRDEYELPDVNPDMVFILGDMYWKRVELIDSFYKCPKFGVLGNHDRMDNYEGTGVINVHEKVIEHKGVTIAGFGGSINYNNREGQYEDWEVESFVGMLEPVDIFLSHGNPAYEDMHFDKEAHRGFVSMNQYIKNKQPGYFFHGHVHEKFQKNIGKTKVFSVYPMFILEI